MSLTDKIHEIKLQIETAEKEIESLTSGRKASAARSRKSLQLIKSLSHSLRKEIVNFTKQLPTKRRSIDVPKIDVPEPIAEEVVAVPKKVRKAKVNKAI